MKLFKISQNENNDYDTYDSAVVCAKDKEEARTIHPSPHSDGFNSDCWATSKESVEVEYIGVAKKGTKKGVICSSFNAG